MLLKNYKIFILIIVQNIFAATPEKDIFTYANWSAVNFNQPYSFPQATYSNNLLGLLPINVSSTSETTQKYFEFQGNSIKKIINKDGLSARAFAIETLIRLPSETGDFFAGTIQFKGEDGRGFFLEIKNNKVIAGVRRGYAHTEAKIEFATKTFNTKKWHHLIFVKSPKHVRLWIDGQLVGSKTLKMQYSYDYKLRDFYPREFRLTGTADVMLLRLHEGWLHKSDIRKLSKSISEKFSDITFKRESIFTSPTFFISLAILTGLILFILLFYYFRLFFYSIAKKAINLRILEILKKKLATAQSLPWVGVANRRVHIVLLILLALILGVNETLKLDEPTYEYRDTVLWGDYMNTDVAARDLADGFGFRELRLQPSFFPRNPLHGMTLAMCYSLFGSGGEDQNLHRKAGSLSFIIACIILYEIFALIFGSIPSFFGVIIFAFYFGITSQCLLSESNSILSLAFFIFFVVHCVRQKSYLLTIAAGLTGGMCFLVRSYFISCFLCASVWFLWCFFRDKFHRFRWLKIFILFSLFFSIAPLSYAFRGFISHGNFTASSTFQLVDPWGQHCGDTPIDFHAWQLYKWKDDTTAQLTLQYELKKFILDFPKEFAGNVFKGIKWICFENMPTKIRLLIPYAIPTLLLFLILSILLNTGAVNRFGVEILCFISMCVLMVLLALSAGHPSGFPETVPRYWKPIAMVLGPMLISAILWLPGFGWLRKNETDKLERITVKTMLTFIFLYIAIFSCCTCVWIFKYHKVNFRAKREFDWHTFSKKILADEGNVPTGVYAIASGTLYYPRFSYFGAQADLLVRNSEYPRGEIRLRLKIPKKFNPLIGSVWGKNVRVKGYIEPDNPIHTFEVFNMKVDELQLLTENFDPLIIAGNNSYDSPSVVSSNEREKDVNYLMDMEPLKVSGIIGQLVFGTTYARDPVELDGKCYLNSISMHPAQKGETFIDYQLNGDFSTFKSTALITSIGNARFMVYGDGILLFETPYLQFTNLHICPMPQTNAPVEITVDVSDCKVLRLAIDKGFHHYSDHATWCDPRLLK